MRWTKELFVRCLDRLPEWTNTAKTCRPIRIERTMALVLCHSPRAAAVELAVANSGSLHMPASLTIQPRPSAFSQPSTGTSSISAYIEPWTTTARNLRTKRCSPGPGALRMTTHISLVEKITNSAVPIPMCHATRPQGVLTESASGINQPILNCATRSSTHNQWKNREATSYRAGVLRKRIVSGVFICDWLSDDPSDAPFAARSAS